MKFMYRKLDCSLKEEIFETFSRKGIIIIFISESFIASILNNGNSLLCKKRSIRILSESRELYLYLRFAKVDLVHFLVIRSIFIYSPLDRYRARPIAS